MPESRAMKMILQKRMGKAMSEVHHNIPSTVKRAKVSGKRKEKKWLVKTQ